MVKHKQNMKNKYLKCLYAVVIVAMTILGISCDKQGLRGIKFPAKQNITCNAGETASFSFSANTAWKLSSDALWWSLSRSSSTPCANLRGKTPQPHSSPSIGRAEVRKPDFLFV